MVDKKISQKEFVKAYFLKRPGIEIPHKQSKQEIEEAWFAETGERMEDPDRAIRSLKDEGLLQKVGKGVYLYDPETSGKIDLDNFTPAEREFILKRDDFKCVTCGLCRESGLELHIDHIKPRSLGGQGTVENGQTLCSRHNFIKKNYSQTETGKKGFIRLLEMVQSQPNDPNAADLEAFLIEVLEVYEKHGINGHIRWKEDK